MQSTPSICRSHFGWNGGESHVRSLENWMEIEIRASETTGTKFRKQIRRRTNKDKWLPVEWLMTVCALMMIIIGCRKYILILNDSMRCVFDPQAAVRIWTVPISCERISIEPNREFAAWTRLLETRGGHRGCRESAQIFVASSQNDKFLFAWVARTSILHFAIAQSTTKLIQDPFICYSFGWRDNALEALCIMNWKLKRYSSQQSAAHCVHRCRVIEAADCRAQCAHY